MCKNQKGAVLILLALCMSVIMLFIALGVDTAILGSSHQRQSRTAELGALAAVEAFLATPGNNNQVKLNAARVRAEQVVGFELNNLMSQTDNSQAQTDDIGDTTAGGQRGTLIPGQYYFSEPVETCAVFNQALNNPATGPDACPCPGNTWRGECFRPHASAAEWDGGADDRPISAFRMDLYTATASPVQTIFAQAGGGSSSFDIASSAISTVTPRHVVFLIDLSGSMSATTHLFPPGNDFSTPPFSSVAFKVDNCSAINAPGATDFDGDGVPDRICTYPGENIPYYFPEIVWLGDVSIPQWPDGMPQCRNLNPTARENVYLHYRDDYECFEIDGDGNPATNDPDYFLVENGYYLDTGGRQRITSGDVNYTGPEPLATVLAGVNETLTTLNILSVPGDQVTFIAHDQNVATAGPRMFGPVSPGDVRFQDLLRLTDHDGIDSASNDNVEGLSKAIIEERIAGQLFPKPDANTDLSEALMRAYVILTQSPGVEIADNQVVIFGDGLGNCPHSQGTATGTANPVTYPDPSAEPFLTSPSAGEISYVLPNKACNDFSDPAIPSEAQFAAAYGCTGGDIYEPSIPGCVAAAYAYSSYVQGLAYYKSITEVTALMTGEGRPLLPSGSPTTFEPFVNNGFKFHAFLFGNHVQPHTIIRKGNSGCMTEGEAREEDLAYADPGSPLDNTISQTPYGASEARPFVKPSYDYQHNLVSPTAGRFFPIRNPCTPAQLNAVPSSTGPTVTAGNCGNGAGLQRLNGFCNDQSGAVGSVINATHAGVMQRGRLICDPYCRGQNDQVSLGIGSLFQDNPIITVEAPPRTAAPPPPTATPAPAN